MPVALNSQLGSKEQADAQLAQAIMSAMRVSMLASFSRLIRMLSPLLFSQPLKAQRRTNPAPGIGKPPTAGGRSCRFPSWRRLYADFSC